MLGKVLAYIKLTLNLSIMSEKNYWAMHQTMPRGFFDGLLSKKPEGFTAAKESDGKKIWRSEKPIRAYGVSTGHQIKLLDS